MPIIVPSKKRSVYEKGGNGQHGHGIEVFVLPPVGIGISFGGTGMLAGEGGWRRGCGSLFCVHGEVSWAFATENSILGSNGGSRRERARSLERFGSGAKADIASFHGHNEQFRGGDDREWNPSYRPPFAGSSFLTG